MNQERNQQKRPGFFTPYSSADPTLNVPVTAGHAGVMSPYMNFDPSYIKSGEAEFIFPEGANRQRGRLELAFSQIGGAVLLGGGFGSLQGASNWYKEVYSGKTDLMTSAKRTQFLNMVGKKTAVHAQTCGTVALTYSAIGVLVGQLGVEGETNIISSATLTGVLYKASRGVTEMMRGGVIGFGLAAVFCLYKNTDKLRYMLEN